MRRGRFAVVLLTAAGSPLAGCATAEQAGTPPAEGSAAVDWSDTAYTLTCDGVVPGGFSATVVGGHARVPADESRPPHYAYYLVDVRGTASGDVDGDGAPDTVVLLDCSPQPSNGVVQEVQVFASTGALLGTLPSPRTLREDGVLPPVYDQDGLTVEAGQIVAAMHAYGPEDYHASGPSVPLTVRWRYAGGHFERAAS